jgi:hypothetical protein
LFSGDCLFQRFKAFIASFAISPAQKVRLNPADSRLVENLPQLYENLFRVRLTNC